MGYRICNPVRRAAVLYGPASWSSRAARLRGKRNISAIHLKRVLGDRVGSNRWKRSGAFRRNFKTLIRRVELVPEAIPGDRHSDFESTNSGTARVAAQGKNGRIYLLPCLGIS